MPAVNHSIQRIMEDIQRGHLVLPDFQRSFIWKPDDVRDLLISMLGDYYVGSMLYMDAIRDESPFALRMIEGIEKIVTVPTIDSIVKILLDGQHRTSSLFYALYAPEIPLSGRKNPNAYARASGQSRSSVQNGNIGVSCSSVSNEQSLSFMSGYERRFPMSLIEFQGRFVKIGR